jgi:hypothetical protein
MSTNSSGRGCRSRAHWDAWAIYESLPREIRDALKIAESNLCCGCVRNHLRRYQKRWGPQTALQRMLADMARWRRTEVVREGRENHYYLREDLRP